MGSAYPAAVTLEIAIDGLPTGILEDSATASRACSAWSPAWSPGLATITPASGYVSPGGGKWASSAVGVCFMATHYMKRALVVDDSLTCSRCTASAA